TDLAYYTAPEDPKDKWKLKSISDRLGDNTTFAYADPDGTAGSDIESVVTDAEGNGSTYRMDGYGRPTKTTNAKGETTSLTWDADNNVVELTEANGATSEWRYDPKTGYPTSIRDAEAVKNNTAATTLQYSTGLDGYTADLTNKTSPEGRRWAFGHDDKGNLLTVTDPKGTSTSTVGDYQSSHTYDDFGQLVTSTDANGNATAFADYHPGGFPKTITDALGNATKSVYDVRGQVTKVTDAKGKSTTVSYDVFGRPGEMVAPKDASAGELITTPAPTYDANDNVTTSTAPNGAVSTAVYDAADQVTAESLPKDTATGPERKSTFAYDKVGNLLTETQPKGTASATAGDYTTSYVYDAIYQLASVTNADGDKISYTYSDVGDLIKVVDPRKNATTDPDDFTAKHTYDSAHRQLSSTDAEGHVSKTGYDLDGNPVTSTDAVNNTTTYALDERAMVAAVTVPHKTGVTRTTKFVYDQVGNRTKVITPRGVETTGEANDFVHETVFDELNRQKEQWSPYDPADARYNAPDKTLFTYDKVGNLAKVSAPPSEGQSVRNEETYSYFDNGLVRSSTDPWDIVTKYDYNDLGQQKTRTLVSAGGTERAMSWSYFPDGKLRSRSDDGVPVGKHVALVDNSDTGNVATTGAWDTDTAGSGFQGYNYRKTSAGLGAKKFTWTPVIPADGDYEVFVKYPSGVSGAATDAKYTVDDGSLLPPTRTVDQTTRGGDWVSIGSYSLQEGNKATVSVSDQATGTVLADAVKLVRDTTGDPADTESKSFEYAYDVNGNLTSLTDGSSGAEVDAYDLSYDGLNQLSSVAEKARGTVENTTSYTYDVNGNTLTRDHDSQDAVFAYDARDLVEQVTNTRTGGSAKVTSYGYTARGQVASEVKPNGNTVAYGYNLDGSVASQTETTTGGGLVARHTLAYNANGHRISDAAKVQNADDKSAYLDHIYHYGFDPQDRLATVEKKTPAGAVVKSEAYVHDANANVVSQTVDSTTTTFDYDRNRLLTASSGGSTASYNYDPFGRLNSVTSAGKIIESYRYDGFDRTTTHKKLNDAGSLESTTYEYDPLDRTRSKTAEGTTTAFDYLGLSDKVVAEEVAGQLSKSYAYSAWGQRLSQVKHDADGGPEESHYGYNLHSDVETLTGPDGTTTGTYGYTAYGKDDETQFTGVDKPDPAQPGEEPYNVYRYQGKRWDPHSESYDMGFRDYSPGLNRFLTRDSYNGALADRNMSVDPWTGNRYAFTGGNPISRADMDGHTPCLDDGDCNGYTYMGPEKGLVKDAPEAQACQTCYEPGVKLDDRADRLSLEAILRDFRVSDDPDGTVEFPSGGLAGLLANIAGMQRQTLAASEAAILDELNIFALNGVRERFQKSLWAGEKQYGGVGQTDGVSDAFRHATWNAMLTRLRGEDWTERYTTAHERKPNANTQLAESMDLYNNYIGRRIAVENPHASEDALIGFIDEAVRSGRLVMIQEGRLVYTNAKPSPIAQLTPYNMRYPGG
ncbi:MAG: hypothetical protein GEU86_18475, partial [Actinophytocola sp.]|nr:hypothetical protein [Actinophytocola sp.]